MGIGTHLYHLNTVPLSNPSCHSNYLLYSSVESIKTIAAAEYLIWKSRSQMHDGS